MYFKVFTYRSVEGHCHSKKSKPMNHPLQQKTMSKWTGRTTDDLAVTSGRLRRPQGGTHILVERDARARTHKAYRERLADGAGRRRARPRCPEHRGSCGEWEGSAGPTKGKGPFSWFVFAGVLLLLGAVLGVFQSAFKPFWRRLFLSR